MTSPADRSHADIDRVRAAANRFPPEIAWVLVDAGWHPGRDISDRIDAWAAANSDKLPGGQLADAPRAFLNEFGGLVLPQYGPDQNLGGGFYSKLHPLDSNIFLGRGPGFREEYGVTVFPIGVIVDDAELAMDEEGRMFLFRQAGSYLVEYEPDDALIELVRTKAGPLVSRRGRA